ncbi:MAG: serine hydrolase domain-containing protein [Actinomycetota bacterium]
MGNEHTIGGTYDPRFEALPELLGASLASGGDVGASAAVAIDGELVVDIWGGHVDEAKSAPWERDTITNVWSSTKTVMALCALLLVDRGELDVDAPVATYWPEFAANGKEGVLVRHLLSHTSGVSGWEQPITVEDLYDQPAASARLATQAPWWEPGTASGYHALNQGHLVGEVIRRITGKQLGEFLAAELTGPFDIDFHIGLPDSEFARVSNIIPPPPLPIDPDLPMDSVAIKTFTGPGPEAEAAWTPEWRRADIGAANGHGNARSLARLQSVITNGGMLDGTQILKPSTIDRIFEVQADGTDLVLGLPIRHGIGYGLPDGNMPGIDPDRRICFWGGWGGSLVMNIVDRNMTVTYAMNRMAEGTMGDERGLMLLAAAMAIVDGAS